ncbi:unnamed protein product [Spirodela intermedia]|uniref:Uncharacterized protein n=1 Tax=Spirodela intermedia TaxID=51605 RepID=A0A7I8LK69_SPIIN|nr:unnamed protein product [Spirodela intermedia]
MEASRGPAIAKKLSNVLRVFYVTLRRGIVSKRETAAHRGGGGGSGGVGGGCGGGSSLSCRSMEPEISYYCPREVAFSCSNTPADYPFYLHRRRSRRRRRSAAVGGIYGTESPVRSPARAPSRRLPLRVADSPLACSEDGGGGAADGRRQVDREAEEFIRRFYEQLRMASLTPARRRRDFYG